MDREELTGRTAATSGMPGGVEKFWNHLDEESRQRLLDAEDRAVEQTARRSARWGSAGMWSSILVGAALATLAGYLYVSRRRLPPPLT